MTLIKDYKTIIFITIEFVLWLLILFINLSIPGRILPFISIVICFIYVLSLNKSLFGYKWMLLSFIFSIIADYFLTLTDTFPLIGTIFFLLAQIMYMRRIFFVSKHIKTTLIAWAISTILICGLVWFIIGDIELLIIISAAYYSLLIINTIMSWKYAKHFLLFAIALTCYLCADTLVGLEEGNHYITYANPGFLNWITSIDFNLIWFFYLPTQTLFALSIKYNHMKVGESLV